MEEVLFRFLVEEGAMNRSYTVDVEGVMHQVRLMWMMRDEEGSERKTKRLCSVLFSFRAIGRGLISVITEGVEKGKRDFLASICWTGRF